MTDEQTFDGWKNRFSQLIALMIDNDREKQQLILDLAKVNDTIERDGLYPEGQARLQVGDSIKDIMTTLLDDPCPPSAVKNVGGHFVANAIKSLVCESLGQVDWYELADYYLETAAEIYAHAESIRKAATDSPTH